MAVITRQEKSSSGGALPTRAAAAGDTMLYEPGAMLLVYNGSAGAITVTVTSRASAGLGTARADHNVPVAAGGISYFIPTEVFRDANGVVALAYSAVAGVTVAVLGR